MTRTVLLVFDTPDRRWIDAARRALRPDDLVKALAKAGVDAHVFVGSLADAPDAWAYILVTTPNILDERAKQAGIADRLARTLGTESNPLAACRFAEAHGLLGVLDDFSSTWFTPDGDKRPSNRLNVKKDIAAKLGWDVWGINSSEHYAQTKDHAIGLPALIVAYLTAALPA